MTSLDEPSAYSDWETAGMRESSFIVNYEMFVKAHKALDSPPAYEKIVQKI
jgi:hypothetical protein